MKPQSTEAFKKLEKALAGLIKIYRHVLSAVRREREILISADLDELNENNRTKETMLLKVRELEDERQSAAKELAEIEGLNPQSRLMEFARHFGGTDGERLRHLHSVLELLLKRVKEHNLQNEVLVNSALDNISGAMGSIRDGLKDKPMYKKSGGMTDRPTESGQLVSKEV